MGNKQIAKNAMFLYIRMAIVMIVSIYMSRIVLAQLGETDYGVYNVVGGVIGMIMSLNSALAFGTQRFVSFYTGKGDTGLLTKVFSSAFFIHCTLALVIAILLETIGLWFVNNVLNIPPDRLSAANAVLHVSAITSFIAILQVPFSAFIIANERMNIYAYISLIDAGIKLLIAYGLRAVSADKLIFYAVMLSIAQILQALFYIVYCLRQFHECHIVIHKEKKLFKDILQYSGWNLLGTFGFMLSDQGINMILNVFFGPAINAARAIAIQVKSAVNQFISNLQTAFNPQLVKLYAEGNKEAMLSLLYNNIRYSMLMMWFILLPLYIELDFLLDIWLIEVPEYTLIFARITLVKLFLVCLEQPFITANGATGYNKVFTVVSAIFLASSLPISYVALNFCEEPAVVFIIDIVVYFAMIVWKIFYLRSQIGLSVIDLLQKSIKPVLFLALFSSPIAYISSILVNNNVLEFFIVGCISVIVNIITAWFFVLPRNAKEFILAKMKRA